jgi:hypothetical protein
MSSGFSFSAELLDQARFLIDLGRPMGSQVDLRRGTSAAYYAVFHLLAEDAGNELIGESDGQRPLRAAVARAFEHGALRTVCERFSGASFPQSLPGPLRPCLATVSEDLRIVTKDLVRLQDLRHRADYDRLKPLIDVEADDALLLARRAVDAWERVRGNQEASVSLLAVVTWKSLATR